MKTTTGDRYDPAVHPSTHDRSHFIVCGGDALAYRLVKELSESYRVSVTVVVPVALPRDGRDFSEIDGVRVLTADRLDEQTFIDAGLEYASGVALAAQDDVGNIHAAMRVQELNPRARIVIRMFNTSLGHRVRLLFNDCAIISDASIAAPAFVEAALGEGAPTYFRHGGRTFFAARRSDVHERDVMVGLADTPHGEAPVVLPLDQETADIVLAVAHGEPRAHADGEASRRRKRRWGIGAALRAMRSGISRTMRIWLGVTLTLQILGTVVLGLAQKSTPWQAIYQMFVTAYAGAGYDSGERTLTQVCKIVIMMSGLTLVPLITAAIVQASVNAKLALNSGKLLSPMSDHIVVVGLGNVGTRVMRTLRDLSVPIVVVDKNESARGAAIARELEIPFIIGDASREETLRAASIATSRAVVIVSTDDVVNLETALNARTARPGLKVVLRLFETDLAERIQRVFNIATTRSVSQIAAPAFAAALMEREVIATIPVSRRVLLVAEFPVASGSPLAGAEISEVNVDQECRVLALAALGEPRPLWLPPPARRLESSDRLTVVATRAGLVRLLAMAAAPSDPLSRADVIAG